MNRKSEIERNLDEVKEKISAVADHEVVLIAVTKSFPASDVEILSQLGIKDFGENRDAEGVEKSQVVAGTWHFQGQIQSNKLKSITSWASVIHSLDDLRHFQLIEKYAPHPLSMFLQVSLDDGKLFKTLFTGNHGSSTAFGADSFCLRAVTADSHGL